MKKKTNKIKIVYCCNDAVFDDLYLSILSILRRTKSLVDISILSADLTDFSSKYIPIKNQHLSALVSLVKKFNISNTLQTIDCRNIYFRLVKKFSKDNKIKQSNHTPYTYFRLLLEHINKLKGKIIYLDTDVMANKDIKSLYDLDISNYELGACHDIIFQKENPKYFNAGVLLLNLNMIRKTHFLDKAFKWAMQNDSKYYDQDALNSSWTKLMFFPYPDDRFDYVRRRIKKDTILKHFAGLVGKPHNTFIIKYLRFMWNWNEDFKIWKQERKKWK